ncbi:MAG: BatA domain-containing protein [Planctomycetes bacterium]|nr:BatA domain-containing protein [Planctomycetota bacterium]
MSFLHAGLLGLAALFTVPLIIHIINRRRYKRVQWAAMEYLLRAYKQNRRRLRLESLLLLLLRCAIPVILAFAIARPRLTQGTLADPLQRQGTHHVFVLDRSYSMGYRLATAERPFDRMKQALVPMLDQIGQRGSEKVTVIYAGERASVPVSADLDTSKAQKALARLEEPSDGTSTLADAIQEATRVIAAEPDPARVYVFSDFHRIALSSGRAEEPAVVDTPVAPVSNETDPPNPAPPGGPGDADAVGFERMRDLCQDLVDGGTKVFFFPVTPRGVVSNTQVTSLDMEPENAVAKVPVRVHAEIVHRGPQPREVLARLRVDGSNEQVRRIRLDTGESGEVSFVVRFLEPGMHSVEIEIGEDGLPLDDRRVLVATVRDRIRVLFVEGRETAEQDDVLQESFLMRSVLDPTRGAGGDEVTLFETAFVDEDRFQSDPSFVRDQDVIALFDVSAPRADVAGRLSSFVARGGGLLLAPGAHSLPDLWNLRSFGTDGQDGVLPLRLLTMTGPTTMLGVDSGGRYSTTRIAASDHPVFTDFENPELRSILEHTPVYRFWQTDYERPPEGTEILAELVGGDAQGRPALLASRAVGRGQCLLLTSNLSFRPDRWNRLDDTDLLRFPLTHSIFHWLARQTAIAANRSVGQSLVAWVEDKPANLYVTRPADRGRVPLPLPTGPANGNEANGWQTPPFNGTAYAGLYRLGVEFEDKTKPAREILFAVNPDPAEGVLDYVGTDALLREFPGIDVRSDLELDVGTATESTMSELGRYFLVLALLVVLGESVLAGFLGTRRQ